MPSGSAWEKGLLEMKCEFNYCFFLCFEFWGEPTRDLSSPKTSGAEQCLFRGFAAHLSGLGGLLVGSAEGGVLVRAGVRAKHTSPTASCRQRSPYRQAVFWGSQEDQPCSHTKNGYSSKTSSNSWGNTDIRAGVMRIRVICRTKWEKMLHKYPLFLLHALKRLTEKSCESFH